MMLTPFPMSSKMSLVIPYPISKLPQTVFLLLKVVLSLVWDTFVFTVAKGQVHVLQALCSSALEEVVNGGVNDDALAGAVDGETADFDAVLAGNVLDER